jgi:signal transduction histidine kinase
MYQMIFGRQMFALLLVALLASTPALSQNERVYQKVDSMKSLLPNATGQNRYELYFQIGYELFGVDNREAEQYSEQAYIYAKELGDSLLIARSGRIYGQLLRRNDKLDEAIVIFNEVMGIAERNNFLDEQKRILNALALAYNFKAMYDRALELNFKSLEIREKEGNKEEISHALTNIGFVYYKIGNFDQALDFFLRSIELKLESGTTRELDQIYMNAALSYVYLGRYEKSREYVTKSYESCVGTCAEELINQGEFCLGIADYNNRNYDLAKEHFVKSYLISKKLQLNYFVTDNSLHIGIVELERQKYDSATKYLFEAEKLSVASGYNQILTSTYKRLSTVYNQLQNYERAAHYQEKYIQLKDSLFNEELLKNLSRAQTNYEERENIKTIAEKNQAILLREQMVQRQKEVYFFVGLVAVLSILGTFMFLRYSRALSKAKQELSVMNQTLEKRVEDRTKQLQNVNNELDNFIYKTSHDIRGPLASLKGIANVALLELKDEKAQDYLLKLDASADKLNSILTRLLIVNQINHAVLNPIKVNFPELINEILVFERKKGVPPRMTILHDIDPDVLLITDRHVLRIILENLIDNAIKYHNSSERIEPFVKIKTSLSPHGVLISVIDNGIGIQERDPQKLFQMFVRASERSESGGIGLYLTKLAAERLYARVDFSVTPEKYTQFTVTIPEDLSKVLAQKEKEENELR